MVFGIVIAIIVILVGITLFSGFTIVPQQTEAIIERLGKYSRTLDPGFHVLIPFIDSVASRVPLRVQQNDISVETKTEDNVFCTIAVSVQFKVDEQHVEDSYYKLQSPVQQIESYIQDAVRSSVPKMKLDTVFENKDDVANDVQKTVSEGMQSYGFVIVNTLITEVSPDEKVKKSMNDINAAQRQRSAAQELAEAERIKTVTEARAKAEAAKLEGEGLAAQRQAIVDGLAKSLEELKNTGISEESVLQLLMLNQYMNTVEQIGQTGNSAIFLPGGADSVSNLTAQLMGSLKASESISGNVPVVVPKSRYRNTPKASSAQE